MRKPRQNGFERLENYLVKLIQQKGDDLNQPASIRALLGLLKVLSCLFALVVSFRYFLYRTGLLRRFPLGIQVISIGNVTAGGTGKTPVTEIFARTLASQGRKVVLKVIIETGLLVTPELIADASFLAMENGADFIKTSTGKVKVNATPVAAWVMCECIKKYYEATGVKVGFKAAGGIASALDAVCYWTIGKTILGDSWMNKDLYRFGVSSLANKLLSAVSGTTVTYF